MSHLVTHSISEDRYGVVQKDLAKIIVDLLTLLQVKHRATTDSPTWCNFTEKFKQNENFHCRPWNDTKVWRPPLARTGSRPATCSWSKTCGLPSSRLSTASPWPSETASTPSTSRRSTGLGWPTTSPSERGENRTPLPICLKLLCTYLITTFGLWAEIYDVWLLEIKFETTFRENTFWATWRVVYIVVSRTLC